MLPDLIFRYHVIMGQPIMCAEDILLLHVLAQSLIIELKLAKAFDIIIKLKK